MRYRISTTANVHSASRNPSVLERLQARQPPCRRFRLAAPMPYARMAGSNGSQAHSWAFPPKSVDFLHCNSWERQKTIRRFQVPQHGISSTSATYMDNGPVARSIVFQTLMERLGVTILTHMPADCPRQGQGRASFPNSQGGPRNALSLEGLGEDRRSYLDWLIGGALAEGVQSNDVIADDACHEKGGSAHLICWRIMWFQIDDCGSDATTISQ